MDDESKWPPCSINPDCKWVDGHLDECSVPEETEADRLRKRLKFYEDMEHRFACLLCHATGGLLSKTNYTKEAMYQAVDDYVDKCVQEAIDEETVEAYDTGFIDARDEIIRLAKDEAEDTKDEMGVLESQSRPSRALHQGIIEGLHLIIRLIKDLKPTTPDAEV